MNIKIIVQPKKLLKGRKPLAKNRERKKHTTYIWEKGEPPQEQDHLARIAPNPCRD
jgi:hypothetical protein